MSSYARSAIIGFGIASALAGCNCGEDRFTVLASGTLTASPAAIDFELVKLGEQRSELVRISNDGDLALVVDGIELHGSSAFSLPEMASSLIIPAGGALDVTVMFAPTNQLGDQAGVLTLASTETAQSVDVALVGRPGAASLCVTPRALHFTRSSEQFESEVTVTACGDENIQVTALDFATWHMDITLAESLELPLQLAAGASRSVRVRYTPSDLRTARAVLRVGGSAAPSSIDVEITATDDIVPPSAGAALYYWRVSADQNENSDIVRLPLQRGGGQERVFWGESRGNGCPGCHQVSPDGRYVAVVEHQVGINLIDTLDGTEISLGAQAREATSMSWRPDTSATPPYQLVFSASGRLHKASAFGGYLGELEGANSGQSGQMMPSWGRDGRIAFVRGQRNPQEAGFLGPTDIMLIDEDGGTPVPLAGASNNGMANYYPSLAPNGAFISFTQSASAQTTFGALDATLAMVATDGSGRSVPLPMINALGRSRSYSSWSVDGRYIGFSANVGQQEEAWDIYLVPIDPDTGAEAGAPTSVTNGNTGAFEHGVQWSP